MSQKLYRKRGTAQIWVLEKFLKKEVMEKDQFLTCRKAVCPSILESNKIAKSSVGLFR